MFNSILNFSSASLLLGGSVCVLRRRPKLDISVMESTGDGPSKREAKHKAAENMIYVLLPQVHILVAEVQLVGL